MKVVPSPSSLTTEIVPPSCSTDFCAIDRPNPDPSFCLLHLPELVEDSKSAAGMPCPVSVTAGSIESSTGFTGCIWRQHPVVAHQVEAGRRAPARKVSACFKELGQ